MDGELKPCGSHQSERGPQFGYIAAVVLAPWVAAMEAKLLLGGEAGDGMLGDRASGEGIRRIVEHLAAQAGLNTEPVGVKPNRVQINLMPVVVRHCQASRSIVEHDAVPELHERIEEGVRRRTRCLDRRAAPDRRVATVSRTAPALSQNWRSKDRYGRWQRQRPRCRSQVTA